MVVVFLATAVEGLAVVSIGLSHFLWPTVLGLIRH